MAKHEKLARKELRRICVVCRRWASIHLGLILHTAKLNDKRCRAACVGALSGGLRRIGSSSNPKMFRVHNIYL